MSQSDPLAGKYIVMPSGCWEWQRAKTDNGYGRVWFHGRIWRAHRVSYELHVGPIPAGCDIHHKCVNPACINPAHLVPATRLENIRFQKPTGRAVSAINRAKTHCSNGHEFTPENTYVDKRRQRHCRKCDAIRHRLANKD